MIVFYGLVFFVLGRESPRLTNLLKFDHQKDQKVTNNSLEQPQPYADTQSGAVISSFVKLCSNSFYGFEISYPKDWFTTYDSDDQKCTFFAPFSFVINAKIDNSLIPIRIEVVSVDKWLETAKFYENPNDFQNIVSSQNIELAGKSIKKIKALATGLGSVPQGLEKFSYLIFDAETPVVIYYQQHDAEEDTQEYEAITEEMSASLKIF